MGFDFSGFVLRAPRTAPSNAKTTATASGGVVRDVKDLPGPYGLPGDLVGASSDQYRASTLQNPDDTATQEYLVWAANTANLTTIEDPSWAIIADKPRQTVSIPKGTAEVWHTGLLLTADDGATRLVVRDTGGRAISDVRSIKILRGDSTPLLPIVIEVGPDNAPYNFTSQDPDAGVVNLNAASLGSAGTPNPATLDGGVSTIRGDAIIEVTYVLAGARFWWSRNDKYVTRFGYNQKFQRWEPRKGGPPVEVGLLLVDETYTLVPRPTRFLAGDYLPGDIGDADKFAMIRLGIRPDSTSTVASVLVVSDEAVDSHSFGVEDAVVGATSGILRFSTVFTDANAGRTIWYTHESFQSKADGVLGLLRDAWDGSTGEPQFLTPVPGPTDYPFIRLGHRRHLIARAAANDFALGSMFVSEGEVGWSMTTGKLKLNLADITKAEPDDLSGTYPDVNPDFDPQYLSNKVYYDGVSMSSRAITTRAPTPLVDETGTAVVVDTSLDLFIPRANPLPSPGESGVLYVPDTSGTLPDGTPTVGTRPNGSGLVRAIRGVGDLIFFGKAGVLEEVEIVEFEDDLPDFPFAIRRGRIWAARERSSTGNRSMVALGRKDRRKYKDDFLYFLQSDVMPAVYTNEARMYGRELEPFTLYGTEKMAFRVDGADRLWEASAMVAVVGDPEDFTAQEVADEINSLIPGSPASALNGRLVLAGSAEVEIGYGSIVSGGLDVRDLSGCAVLGFMPGWRAEDGIDNWLPDNGSSVGLFRSPLNLDRSSDIPDFVARAQFDDVLLSQGVSGGQFFTVDNPPIQDVAGYDVNIFFQLVEGLNLSLMENYEDVLYDFGNSRIGWIDQANVNGRIEQATTAISLGNPSVVPDSFHPAVATGNGLYLAAMGGAYTPLELGVNYLLPGNGATGQAVLIDLVGSEVAVGSAGSVTAGGTTFTDLNAKYLTNLVAPGYLLYIQNGENKGWYVVDSVTSETVLEVEATVPFVATETFISYAVQKGFTPDVFDPALLADIQYEVFNHLPEEPFKVRLLSLLGPVPADEAAQKTSRLVAVATESLQRGRNIFVRFGLDSGNPEAVITALTQTELGPLANGSGPTAVGALRVPDLTDPHFTDATAADPSFLIQVGSKQYTIGVDLIKVTGFTLGLAGDVIQYGDPTVPAIAGKLNFGQDVLADLEGSQVYYFQSFLAASALATGTAEIDPATGELNLADADLATHAGVPGYFVEQMITEQSLDVNISPLNGTAYFHRPLRSGQIVETSYFQAATDGSQKLDDDGNPIEITEFLPLFVRQEEATVIDPLTYSYNPTGRTIAAQIELVVWVGPNRQNYGSIDTASFDTTLATVGFAEAVDPADIVRINYAVYEAFGGEQSYSVSTPPVYRPPFFLNAETAEFTLETDRTAEMATGKMLRIGATPLYLTGTTYDAGTDLTTVTFFPETLTEIGSRAPGNDLNSLLSSEPVATNTGFLMPLLAAYEPVDSGMLSIIFKGNVMQYAVAGHLLEVGGYPFIIAAGTLSPDGLTTRIDVTTAFPKGFAYGIDPVRISVRPIYPPNPRAFLGQGPVVDTEPYDLILFGETDATGVLLPGRTLFPGIDYILDSATGQINLLDPQASPLFPGQRLVFIHTKLGILMPFLSRGVLNFPRFRAKYAHLVLPSEQNQILGSTLQATYTFHSPDSFYFRAVPLSSYMGEVAQQVAAAAAAQSPTGGPTVTPPGEPVNHDQGNLGFEAQRSDLVDQDRASRTFISLYNEIIVAFEQIMESMGSNGGVIGDRHGKFRHFVGRGRDYPGPGYEDPLTGVLIPRNVWPSVFRSANGIFTVTLADPIVDPETAIQDPITLVVKGDFMDPDLLRFYIDEQQRLIRNDIDDYVLAGRLRPKIKLKFPPFPVLVSLGDYRQMGENHRLSRLFPESTFVFTTTYPGILADEVLNDPGLYTFRKMLEPPKLFKGEGAVYGSTFKQPIGSLSNPSLGTITNPTDTEIRERLPRARIWAYSETGFPDIDAATDGLPTIIATPLFLKDFPVDPDTGLPDTTKLISQLGTLPDLLTGDMELSTPAFKVLDVSGKRKDYVLPQVAFGRPDGTTFAVGNAQKTIGGGLFNGLFDNPPVFGGVFVGAVYKGCLITFVDDEGNNIESGSDLLALGSGELEGSPMTLEKGDTIFVIPPGSMDTTKSEENPNIEEQEEYAKNMPTYRRGFDIGVNKRTGEFRDLSLPSFKDPSPFGLKEILGQRGPDPLSTIEADVEFFNSRRQPHQFPALKGEVTNDYGDYGIPYLSISGTTETDRLGAVTAVSNSILLTDAPANSQSVYPEEIVGTDGTVISPSVGTVPAATLRTAVDLSPGLPYTANTGVGAIKRGDILMVEVPGTSGLPDGAQGIINIGEVDAVAGELEPPRFVTPTLAGDRFRFRFDNAMTHISVGGTGMVVTEVAGTTTTLDITSLGVLAPVFNNGTVGIFGGLNDLLDGPVFAFPNDNEITIDIISQATGLVVETIIISGTAVTGGAGGVVIASAVTADAKILTIPAVGFVSFPALGTVAPGPSALFDFVVHIQSYNSGLPLAGSHTGYIDADRLTYIDTWDMRSLQARGVTTIGALSIEGRFNPARVTADGNEDCTVNAVSETNATTGFTFLPRDDTPGTPLGTFSTGIGTVKVMAFEAHGNAPITTTAAVVFTAIPSSTEDETGIIAAGSGTCLDSIEAIRAISASGGAVSKVEAGDICQIIDSAVSNAAVKAGTYLVRHAVAEAGSTPGAREMTLAANAGAGGAWVEIVFPTVTAFDGTLPGLSITVTDTSGPGPGSSAWTATGRLYVIPDKNDPTSVVSMAYTSIASDVFTLTSDTGLDAAGAPFPGANPTERNAVFFAAVSLGLSVSGFVYVPMGTSFPTSLPKNNVVGFDNGVSTAGGLRHLTLSNPAFFPDVTSGSQAQSFVFATATGTVNTVVIGTPGDDEVGITIATKAPSTAFLPNEAEVIYDDVAEYMDLSGLAASTTDIWDTIHTDGAGTTDGVKCVLPQDKFTTNAAVDARGNGTGADGFLAAAGLFMEPSWVRPTINLGGGLPLVVDAGHALAASQVGMRAAGSFFPLALQTIEDGVEADGTRIIWKTTGAAGIFEGTIDKPWHPLAPGGVVVSWTSGGGAKSMTDDGVGGFLLGGDGTPASSTIDYLTRELVIDTTGDAPDLGTIITIDGVVAGEGVSFEVRRIRRFKALLDGLGDNLAPLRFAYEIRRAVVDGASTAQTLVADLAPYGTATQLGGFRSEDVNINAGDEVRLLDALGNVVDSADIAMVFDDDTLLLSAPGLPTASAGDNLYIFLRQAPVPHEQSNEQLLEIITDTEVLERVGVPSTGEGGAVAATNVLSDSGVDLTTIGAQVGDIVLVDPAGELSGPTGQTVPPEEGRRPIGDVGVPERGPALPYKAGVPSNLDDNRGWYRITELGPTEDAAGVKVTGETAFTGPDSGNNAVFGETDQEYAVYPTVSLVPEGQMDLRVTAFAVANSYQTGVGIGASIAPFSYRVIRPVSFLTDETIDLVFMHRERILSWMEEIAAQAEGSKQGSYFVFQRDEHISDVGSPTDSADGLGVPSNLALTSLSGLVTVSPFMNTEDCLSVLDRRYWILDLSLDSQRPPGASVGTDTYSSFEVDGDGAVIEGMVAGSGRPVMPDLIDEVLDRNDRLRRLRFAWIRFRTDKVSGTLPAISRFDAELPLRIQEQQDLLALKAGLDEV